MTNYAIRVSPWSHSESSAISQDVCHRSIRLNGKSRANTVSLRRGSGVWSIILLIISFFAPRRRHTGKNKGRGSSWHSTKVNRIISTGCQAFHNVLFNGDKTGHGSSRFNSSTAINCDVSTTRCSSIPAPLVAYLGTINRRRAPILR